MLKNVSAYDTDIDQTFFESLWERTFDLIGYYDIIFYIPFNNSIPIEKDGIRNTNPEYIQKIDEMFNHYLKQRAYNRKYYNLYGFKVVKVTEVALDKRIQFCNSILDRCIKESDGTL
jgi:hypothetical protein